MFFFALPYVLFGRNIIILYEGMNWMIARDRVFIEMQNKMRTATNHICRVVYRNQMECWYWFSAHFCFICLYVIPNITMTFNYVSQNNLQKLIDFSVVFRWCQTNIVIWMCVLFHFNICYSCVLFLFSCFPEEFFQKKKICMYYRNDENKTSLI